MIIKETIIINGIEYQKTYSDSGRYVVRNGAEYVEAIDPIGFDRAYEEGAFIPFEEEVTEEDFAKAGRVLMGL